MSAWTIARSLGLAVVVSSWAFLGCGGGDNGGYGYGGGGYGGSSTSTDDAGTSSNASGQPMLVVVDSNRTMSASPGQGVGVFTQYQTGGHWNIWWSCDTDKTSLPCAFDVTVTTMSGTIANPAGQGLQGSDAFNQSTTQEVEAVTNTTTTIEGITFDTVVSDGTTPIITVDAKLNGVDDPSYFFFVQDGEINGGFQGSLTDPLMFEPSSP
jgi:hypothetical protein